MLSSHLLDEVERVCDHLVLFSEGRVLLSEPMEAVLERHYRICVRLSGSLTGAQLAQSIPAIFKTIEDDGEWELFCYAHLDEVSDQLRALGVEILDQRRLSLNETFIARSPERTVIGEAA